MKHLVFTILALALTLSACHTTVENYRQSYDRAIAHRDSTSAEASAIYGADRRPLDVQTIIDGTDTIELRVQRVAAAPNGGIALDSVCAYCVVVAQFKQEFTAKSLRQRLLDAGQNAFVLQTAEPFYYVATSTHSEAADAIAAIRALRSKSLPIAIRKPFPYLLRIPGR